MKLYKIIDTVIPYMWNTPCKIAIFTDGRRMKIYEKVFPRCASGSASWVRHLGLEERFRTPQAEEVYLSEIENETAKAVKQYIAEKTRQTKEAQ